MLSRANNCLSTARANNNMVEVKVIHSVQQGYEKASVHRKDLRKVHFSIGWKRRKAMVQLVKEMKGAIQ